MLYGDVREYQTADEMLRAYAERKRRMNAACVKPKPKLEWSAPQVAVMFDWSKDEADRDLAGEVIPGVQNASDILREVADKHGVLVREIKGPWRNARMVRARQEAMWRLREERPLSFPQIGMILGGRDHTTALHGWRKHAARVARGEA